MHCHHRKRQKAVQNNIVWNQEERIVSKGTVFHYRKEKIMTITYEDGSGLYINSTNRCTNNCDFCVRTTEDGYYGNLWLEREPTVEEIIADIDKRDLSRYTEVVFCGYGEPTVRLDDIIEIAGHIKEICSLPVRINTNGLANLYYGEDITYKFEGVIDAVSVSLNAANPDDYVRVCHPVFGDKAFEGILDFTAKVTKYVPGVYMSVVEGFLPEEDIDTCRALASFVGAELRVRKFIG